MHNLQVLVIFLSWSNASEVQADLHGKDFSYSVLCYMFIRWVDAANIFRILFFF
jgi:hypothetical protein